MNFTKNVLVLLFTITTTAMFAQSARTTLFDEIIYNWRNSISLESMYTYTGKNDISKDRTGKYSSNSVGITAKIQGLSSSKKHALTAFVNYNYLDANFDCIDKPFNEIQTLTTSAFYVYRIDEKWAAFSSGKISFSAEETSDWDNAVQGFIGLGAIYNFSEQFRVGFGAMAYSQLDDDWVGFPTVFIDWKITEKLSLRTFSGIALVYDAMGDGFLILDAMVEYKNSYTRIKDGSSVRDSYGSFSVGGVIRPSKRFYVGTRIGINFSREMDFEKSSTQKIDIDTAPTISIFAGINW